MTNKVARYVNMLLGLWLFVSAFIWPHTSAQFTNTWLMGLIAVACAAIALGVQGFRFVNTAVGLWLIISGFVLPTRMVGTSWNNILVGLAIIIVSLVSSGPYIRSARHAQSTV